MSFTDDILYRYLHFFYPHNQHWMTCNNTWSPRRCRCVDEVELNAAILLLKTIKNIDADYSFEFRSYKNNPDYPMKIADKAINIDSLDKCVENQTMKIIKERSGINTTQPFDSSLERKIVFYQQYDVVYVVLCLIAVNRNESMHRVDIIKYLFLKKAEVFLKYISEFSDFVCREKVDDFEFIKTHLGLINSTLEIHAKKASPNILGDVFEVFNEDLFQLNYDCYKKIGNLIRVYKENVAGITANNLPYLNLSQHHIAKLEELAKEMQACNKVNDFNNIFRNICENLNKIFAMQKRTNDSNISKSMLSFEKYINSENK